ncbi:MAG: prolyl oligopeptidase family serine peptidase [Chitinophagaceae bacterium]|nr:prolyl oligopeptidase family serine peptidase [Chitinophagaceae bacterium]
MGRQPQLPRGIAGWLEGSNGLLVYDHYDIWQLDITGKKTAKNLTNGRKNNIRFMITPDETGEGGPCAMYKNGKTFFESNSRLVLTALNMENKDNGFYTLSLGNKPLLERLYMGPYMFYHGDLSYGQARLNIGCKPLKARDTDVWLLTRQSATEAPNYYVTRGMKEFKRLTALQPHKDYNWLQAELINFEQQDGSHSKGILYKPENFDSSKKYPVIIHYYTQYSLFLNQYQKFDYTESADINIPWFVTRGYLIFMADIYFNKDWAGDAAVNAVEGAASWLAKQSYVDSTKMGIAGHSWGGTLTNYLVTHTNRFAAAFCGAAGASDVIGRGLLPERGDGSVNLKSYESYLSQTIWENSEKWIKASPVMSAHKITTPYLIYHCAIEGVPFQQATEMFVAMRRLGKKVWLLQYDESWHSTQNERDSRDLTIRVTQFFDHYLKGAHAPVWMTRGIRAQFKGIETGYEIDESGRLP